MFKKMLCATALLLTMYIGITFAQDEPTKNVISAGVIYNRQGVDVAIPGRGDFSYDAAKDGFGPYFSYTRFLGNSPFGIGAETNISLHNKDISGNTYSCGQGCVVTEGGDRSKVQTADFNGTLYVQKRTGTIQPFAKGLVGFGKGRFDGTVALNGAASIPGGTEYHFGGGGGFDLCFGPKKDKCWRNGLDIIKGFGSDVNTVDVRFRTGFAIKFGSR